MCVTENSMRKSANLHTKLEIQINSAVLTVQSLIGRKWGEWNKAIKQPFGTTLQL